MKKQKRTLNWDNLYVESFVTNLKKGESACLAGGRKSPRFGDDETEGC